MPTPKAGYIDEQGNPLPGVTTILKQMDVQYLVEIANKMGLKGREVYGPKGEWTFKADIGTCTHARIEAYINGGELTPINWCMSWAEVNLTAPIASDSAQKTYRALEIFAESEKAFKSFLDWAKDRPFHGKTEVGLISSRGFGGTIDYIDDMTQEVYDWKTSRELGASAIAQVCGGYSILCEERLFVPRLYHVVRFPKEGGQAEQWTIHAGSPTAQSGRVLFESLLASYKATAEIESVNKMRLKMEKAA